VCSNSIIVDHSNEVEKQEVALSSFTQEQVLAVEELLRESGLEYSDRGAYVFSNGEKKKTLKTLYAKLNFPETLSEYDPLRDLALDHYQGKFPDKEFKRVVDDYCQANSPSKELVSPVFEISVAMKERISKLAPLIDASLTTKERLILVDPENDDRPVHNVSTEIYLATTGLKMAELLSSQDIPAVYRTYNPYRYEALFEDYDAWGELVPYVNYYTPPRWVKVKAQKSYGGKIRTLIDHLFPEPEEKEKVLDWMHHSITTKCGTILCLVGNRGIGKTLLVSNLLSALMGESNVEVVNSEILEEKFNSAFKNKRLLLFEEVEITSDKALNKFKAFCNERIVVEEKGQDSETVTSFASMVVMLNNTSQLKVMPQERRFSIPTLTEKRLLDVMSAKEISDFVQELRNPESVMLAEFGEWLRARKPRLGTLDAIKGKYYFQVSATNLEDWKSFLITELAKMEVGDKMTIRDAKKNFKKSRGEENPLFPTKPTLISGFFMEFMYDGECRIGKIVANDDTNGTFSLMVTPEYKKLAEDKMARGERLIDYGLPQRTPGSPTGHEEDML